MKRRNAKVATGTEKTKRTKRTKMETGNLPEGWEMSFDEKTGRFNLSFPMNEEPTEASGGKSLILAGASGKFKVPVDFQDEDGNEVEVTMYGCKVYAKINSDEE